LWLKNQIDLSRAAEKKILKEMGEVERKNVVMAKALK